MSLRLSEKDLSVAHTAKEFGAFYTDDTIARFLVAWAIRSPKDTVLDPSFGGGAFLMAAAAHVRAIGGQPSKSVFGVEIDPRACRPVAEYLLNDNIPLRNFIVKDFFDIDPGKQIPLVDAVVGNPPFIRYQRFNGESRSRALERARAQNVHLTELSSSWAPFVVHSSAMLKPGGRLGMVAPAELGHAAYALPVIRYLKANFAKVTFLTFEQKLFPHLNEDTILILADGKNENHQGIFTQNLWSAESLKFASKKFIDRASRIDQTKFTAGSERLIEYLLPRSSRRLLESALDHSDIVKVGEIVDVGIGYVTGANDFFHISPEEIEKWKIDANYLRPAVRRGRSLRGVNFTEADWKSGLADKESGYLLFIEKDAVIDRNLQRYLDSGIAQNIHEAYKCRKRSSWYSVPHVYQPDAFLTYMSGNGSRFVVNSTQSVAPNSLHVVRLLNGQPLKALKVLAISWHTSLTKLSAEITGHPMGGGMLKLEPTEAERVAVAVPHMSESQANSTLRRIDKLVRDGREEEATALADQIILQEKLGFSSAECEILNNAASALVKRRTGRTAQ